MIYLALIDGMINWGSDFSYDFSGTDFWYDFSGVQKLILFRPSLGAKYPESAPTWALALSSRIASHGSVYAARG